MARLVLTDSSPLIGLSRIDGVPWLKDLFGRVAMTAEVLNELRACEPLEPPIRDALAAGWLYLHEPQTSPEPPPAHLGVGEWSLLQAAQRHPAPCLVLLDDRLALREAQRLNLRITGTAALIGMAQQRGLLGSARDAFAQLLRKDFRIAPEIIRAVLARIA